MSASDSNGIFVELGEYNLIVGRANLAAQPHVLDAINEVWLGDSAAVDAALAEVKPAGSSPKAIALLRLKGRGSYLSTQAQAQSVNNPGAVESFVGGDLGAENMPAGWAWVNAANGGAQQSGSKWLLDAAPKASVDEALDKLRGWSLEIARCQSATISLVGGLVPAIKSGAVLLVDIAETRSFLFSLSAQGVIGYAVVPVGFDTLAGATQTALGLKFRGSAARLMFNDSYDFGEAGPKIVEPLATAIKGVVSTLGSPAPTQLVCGGVLARQTWITQSLASAISLQPYAFDAAGWAAGRGLTFGSGVDASKVSPSWAGLLSAAGSYDVSNPGAAKPWNVVLSGTPVAASATPPPPAIIPEPPKPAAKPAEIPAIIQEPAKVAAKPAAPQPPPPKPAVIITPPSKPAETKPAAPAQKAPPPPVAKQPEPPKQAAKPTEPAKPAPTPAKPAPAPVIPQKAPAKPEPAKPTPAPASKPAPAPTASKGATAAPFPPKKNKMPLIIGLVALLLVGGIGAWVYTSGQEKARIEAESRKRAEEEREKRLQQEAERARLAEQKLREEEEQRRQQAIATEEALKRTQVDTARTTAERLLNARGSLSVATQPAGATVTVGELAPRTSPVSIRDLRLGRYAVTISLPGYDIEKREIEIRENQNTDLGTIALKRQVGTIELSSDPSGLTYEIKPANTLFVNPSEIRTGQTPATVSGLPVGAYAVTISRPNWTPFTRTVNVERNGNVRLNGEFPGGSVVINSTPEGATVLRDNQMSIGTTPLTLNGIQPSDVSYTLTLTGYDPATVSGRVEGGKTLNLSATLLDSDRIVRQSELDTPPSAIEMLEPEYSASQRLEGGSAMISLVVGPDGVPVDVRVEQASNRAFGIACQIAVTKWRFKPGILRGKPVKTRVTIPFKITGE